MSTPIKTEQRNEVAQADYQSVRFVRVGTHYEVWERTSPYNVIGEVRLGAFYSTRKHSQHSLPELRNIVSFMESLQAKSLPKELE